MIRRTLAISIAVVGSLLSGCVAVPVDGGHGHQQQYSYDRDGRRYYDRDGQRHYDRDAQRNYDRDRDGVPNSQDRRPDDPRRH